MRTIKFKGKSVEDGQWNYGDLSHVANQTLIKTIRAVMGVLFIRLPLTARPSANSLASPTRTARRSMRAMCCGLTTTRSVV